MQLTNATTNCSFILNDDPTFFLQFSHNEKREFFFRVLWGKLKPSYYYDAVEDHEEDIVKIDHISFHEDGRIHHVYYKDNKIRDEIDHRKLAVPILSMTQDHYMAFLIMSIYDLTLFKQYCGQPDPLIRPDHLNSTLNFKCDGVNKLSIVIFLLGSNIDRERLFKERYPGVFNIGASPLLLNYFGDESKVKLVRDGTVQTSDFGLLVGCTERVLPMPSFHNIASKEKLREMTNVTGIYNMRLVANDEEIRSLSI